MTAASFTAANASANWDRGAIIENREAAEVMTVFDVVALLDDDTVVLAEADALDNFAKRIAFGIVVAIAKAGTLGIGQVTSAAVGDRVSVCTFGNVHGWSSLTEGAYYYVSNTAGDLEDTPPANQFVVGRATHSDTFFVNPGTFNAPS